jgi:transcriptional regulator with XRE-family HTH domain
MQVLFQISPAKIEFPDTDLAASRKPRPEDIHVGSRVRYRRMIIGMSQEKLGEKMNLTFQQIQKYEKGTNRIGASRLFQLSKILNVEIGYFFEGLDNNASAIDDAEYELRSIMSSKEGLALVRAFQSIPTDAMRWQLVNVARALSACGVVL